MALSWPAREVYQCNKGQIELSTIWLEMAERRSNRTKPQRRDPVATRNKLLTAARHEFSKNGLAGARVVEIALRAGVNKQLVYHYFGDKDALYLAVLEWVYEEIRAQERKLNLTGLPPERAIKKLIESSFDHLDAHPDCDLGDVAYTLQMGRAAFSHRRTLVCAGNADAVSALRQSESSGSGSHVQAAISVAHGISLATVVAMSSAKSMM